MTHRIYLSGPMSGVNPIIAQGWRERFEKAMHTTDGTQIECINPMRFIRTTPMKNEDPGYITTRDRFDVQRADLLVVNFLYGSSQAGVSIGTVIEMAWADTWRKPIIMAAPLDNVTPLFSHPLIRNIVTTVVHTEEELAYQARAFLSLTEPSNEKLLTGPTAEPTPEVRVEVKVTPEVLHVAQRSGRSSVGKDNQAGHAYCEDILKPALRRIIVAGKLVVDFDDERYGYPASFLNPAFGGLIPEFGEPWLKETLELRCSDEPYLVGEVWNYIRVAEARHGEHAAKTAVRRGGELAELQ